MNLYRRFSLLAVMALFLFSACEIVDEPVDPDRTIVSNGRTVLLEDFTGHKCGTCPRAHEVADRLKSEYGKDVVIVSLHVGGFSDLYPSLGLVTDFKTTLGSEIAASYGIGQQLPQGMVNRREVGGTPLSSSGEWSTRIAAILREEPILDISLAAEFDPDSRNLSVEAELKYLKEGDANHHVVALITEDDFVAPQIDYSQQPDFVPEYVHQHVLRKGITEGVNGQVVKGERIFVGERINKTFSTQLDAAWNAENCNVVVYVLDAASKEVLQAAELHL